MGLKIHNVFNFSQFTRVKLTLDLDILVKLQTFKLGLVFENKVETRAKLFVNRTVHVSHLHYN